MLFRSCIARLDSLFLAPSTVDGDASPDISGMIGQFAHGNEPSHHILYLYTMLGEPQKTAERVREVMSTQYRNNFDGLSGNEDMGQMSAWYLMSALGFYQVVGLAVELYALDVDVGGAVTRCLNDELAALDGEFGTVNGG